MVDLKKDCRRHGVICVFLILEVKSSLKSSLEKNEYKKNRMNQRFLELSIVPTIGLEPTTYALRVHCSTN